MIFIARHSRILKHLIIFTWGIGILSTQSHTCQANTDWRRLKYIDLVFWTKCYGILSFLVVLKVKYEETNMFLFRAGWEHSPKPLFNGYSSALFWSGIDISETIWPLHMNTVFLCRNANTALDDVYNLNCGPSFQNHHGTISLKVDIDNN